MRKASRADRAFVQLVLAAAGLGGVLLVPLIITVVPGELERALHGYDALAQECVAALYQLGARLPPLGALTLAVGGASLLWGVARTLALFLRTRSALARRRASPPPDRLRSAAISVGVLADVVCFDEPRPQAYCAGLLRPRIFVSTGVARRLKQSELEAVLQHESYHLRHRDPLRIFVVRALSSTLFAVPIVRSCAERFEVAKELDADQLALARSGGKRALAGALLKMSRSPIEGGRLAIGTWSPSRARVDQLCGVDDALLLPRSSAPARWLTGLTLAAALLLGLGQTARANLLPAGALESLGLDTQATEIHSCPLPRDGILL